MHKGCSQFSCCVLSLCFGCIIFILSGGINSQNKSPHTDITAYVRGSENDTRVCMHTHILVCPVSLNLCKKTIKTVRPTLNRNVKIMSGIDRKTVGHDE